MADDKSSSAKGVASTPGKRPYATLDLKATEVKVTPVAGRTQRSDADDAQGKSASFTQQEAGVPLPAPARSYASPSTAQGAPQSETRKPAAESPKFERSTAKPSATAPGSQSSTASDTRQSEPKITFQRRGSFFTHLSAGVLGGLLTFLALQWMVPQLGLKNGAPPSNADTAMLSERLAALEKSLARANAQDLSTIENRLAELEKTAQAIPALADDQKRLVAETKAALAAAASDAGSPQLIERLGKVEDRLKALAEAGANDPGSSRIEQLAALIGKIDDLKMSFSTELSALRSSVVKDVEAKLAAVTEVSEAARVGTERISKEIAALKNDNIRLDGQIAAAKDAADHLAADIKRTQDQTAGLSTAIDNLKTASAKRADISAAIAPISDRITAVEKSIADVVKSDEERKTDAAGVVLALELQNLKRAIDSGQNFSAELDEVKRVAGNRVDLSALTRLQDTGVPPLAELTNEFRTAADRAIDADSEPENASVVDRLWAGARSIVRVRRIDLKPDDKSTEAIVGRMQNALSESRLADVLEAAKDLSPKAQDAAQPFLDKVAARVSVDAALSKIEKQLKSSLAASAAPAPQPLP
jgi:hypothetical protein